MGNRVAVERFRRWLKFWLWTLVDAIPPYRRAEGVLEDKEIDSRGSSYIRVASVRIEVDKATYEALAMGEELHVRYTRGKRAVNIDRLSSGPDQE